MTHIFLYDSLNGKLFRCMFAGVDNFGHAQWVNITPGEEPKTLDEYVKDENIEGTRFFVLSLEGETAESIDVAKALGRMVEGSIYIQPAELNYAVTHMQELGVKWNKKPLELIVRVFENSVNSNRAGKYSFWIENKRNCCDVIADVDGFGSLDDLFRTVSSYLMVLKTSAAIPIQCNDLKISTKLMDSVEKNCLSMFNCITNH